MLEITTAEINLLEHDLALRGYGDEEIQELLHMPFFIIPGPVTPEGIESASQKLTKLQVFLAKELMKDGVQCKIVEHKSIPRHYIEDRHAHVDLGTVVAGILAAQQLGAFANIAQILDFILNVIQLKFSRGRTEQLMPNVKFELELHNNDKMIRINTEVPADQVVSILKSKQLQQLVAETFEPSDDD